MNSAGSAGSAARLARLALAVALAAAAAACDERVLLGSSHVCPHIGSNEECNFDEVCVDLQTDDCDPRDRGDCPGRCAKSAELLDLTFVVDLGQLVDLTLP